MRTIEAACRSHFRGRDRASVKRSAEVVAVTNSLLALSAPTKDFAGKGVLRITPIYAKDIRGPAYYEVCFTRGGREPSGWLLVSVTDRDRPLTEFSVDGTPPSMQLASQLSGRRVEPPRNYRIFRFGAGYCALENTSGHVVAELGSAPTILPVDPDRHASMSEKGRLTTGGRRETLRREGISSATRFSTGLRSIDGYERLTLEFPRSHFTAARAARASDDSAVLKTPGLWSASEFTVHEETRRITGDHGYHRQIGPNSTYNQTNGDSGCNNNAWVNLYCWWSISRGRTKIMPRVPHEGCPRDRQSVARQDAADPVQIWLMGECGTGGLGQLPGYTSWTAAHEGVFWAGHRGYTPNWAWAVSSGGGASVDQVLDDYLWDNRRPVHVGYGNHFAVGVASRRWTIRKNGQTILEHKWVEVYPGWHGDDRANKFIQYDDVVAATGVHF